MPLAIMQETDTRVHSFVRKSQALACARQQQGRTAAAVSCLGSSISLLASLGVNARSARPLVQSLVMTRTKLHTSADEDTADAQRKLTSKAGSRCGNMARVYAQCFNPRSASNRRLGQAIALFPACHCDMWHCALLRHTMHCKSRTASIKCATNCSKGKYIVK